MLAHRVNIYGRSLIGPLVSRDPPTPLILQLQHVSPWRYCGRWFGLSLLNRNLHDKDGPRSDSFAESRGN